MLAALFLSLTTAYIPHRQNPPPPPPMIERKEPELILTDKTEIIINERHVTFEEFYQIKEELSLVEIRINRNKVTKMILRSKK
jgi:hypothetical protein